MWQLLTGFDKFKPHNILSLDLFYSGLAACNFVKPTDIQRESVGLALNDNDILGAAKTGSGKTLAFIIPVSN